MNLGTIMLLDKVQKGQRIDADEAKRLKAAKLVEGRYPNLLVAVWRRPRATKPSTFAIVALTTAITVI